MYAIQVVKRETRDDGSGGHVTTVTGLPTFYLDENVQGIVNAGHATHIARKIIGDADATITAVRL